MRHSLARGRALGALGSLLTLACASLVACSSSDGDPEGSAGSSTGGVSNAAGNGNSGGGPNGMGGGGTAGASTGSSGSSGAPTAGTSGAAAANGGASSAGASAGGASAGGASAGGAVSVGDPTTHTQADVCAHWKAGHLVTETKPLTASGAECEAGTLKPGAIIDTLVRINLFRWLEGMGPVSDDAQYDSDAQACANLEAWWDFKSTASPHAPPNTTKCYTAIGGSTAGQSNISWGSGGPAQSIDQYMEDKGNEMTLGHRRWVLNPPLNPIGIGYWQTGGQYGNSNCLRVFGNKGTGPVPKWNAVPPAGFAPIEMAKYKQWSFEGKGMAKGVANVLRVDDNTPLAVDQQALSQGYGEDTMSFKPSGWTAEAGKTYRVTISGLTGGNITYDVKPVTCN